MAPSVQLYGLDWCFVLSCVMIISWISVLVMYLISLIYGKTHLHKRHCWDNEKNLDLPGVSIIKPLNGLSDPNLVDNLSTFFSLDYPKYELLFCVQDEAQQELIKVLNGLMAKYPTVDSNLFVGAMNVGVNPKVNNMMNAYTKAKYPLVLISDAGISMKDDTLKDMVAHLTEKVGLVHQLPFMMDGDLRFSRIMEKVYFGGSHARVYLSANACGINCMTGMSCLFRKKILDEEGGLQCLSCYLGEDFFLSQLFINKGWRVVISSQPTGQNPGLTSVSSFKARMMRWMYLRIAAMPQLLVLEPLQEHIILAPLTSLAVQYIFSIPFYIFLPVHIVAWCLMDYALVAVIENGKPKYSLCSHIKAWLVREVMFIYLYLNVLTMRYVSWGGKKFIIHFGGKTTLINGDLHQSILPV